MKTKRIIIIELQEQEAKALKTLLGDMNDKQFAEHGIKGADREYMGELFNSIPYGDDE